QIAGQHVTDLLVARQRVLLQSIGTGCQHSRRAEPALQPVMLAERLLQWAQRIDRTHAFDGVDPRAIRMHSERQARPNAVTVDKDGPPTPHPMLTADMGAGEAERVAEKVRQQQPGLHLAFNYLVVDDHPYRSQRHWRCAHVGTPWAR